MPGDTESGAFSDIVVDLSNGELMFPQPFDPATSAALATGAPASTTFEVKITAVSGSYRRDVLDTKVASARLLAALLEGLLDEIFASEQSGQDQH